MSLGHGAKIVTDGLRGLCDAKNSKSYSGIGTIWNDLSTYGNNWAHTNVTYNSAGYFTYNGSSDYSRASPTGPSSFSGDNNTTSIGVWFRPHTVSPATTMSVITDNYIEWGIQVLTNGNIAGYGYGNVQTAGTANQWTYCVVTVNAAAANSGGAYTTKLYKDGVYINQATGTVGNGLNDWPLTLGYDAQGGTNINFFDGDIARVELYQKVLSDAEVKQNFNALRGRFGI